MKAQAGLLSLIVLIGTSPLFAAKLESNPNTFDFGWAPDNARLFADYHVSNIGGDAVNLQALKPACGCTAAKFTPMSLSKNADTKISLAFNTRGYKGTTFNKSAELTTEGNTDNLTVFLKGYVLNPNATFLATGTGIASFTPESKKSSEKITLQNKGDKDLALHIVQPAASWAKAKLSADTIKAGGTVELSVSISGSNSEARETSLTIEGTSDDEKQRLTVAIRTGAERQYQPIRPTAPAAEHTHPTKKGGPGDPLKLKAVEPVKK